jgi:magnesium-transporting ATPase (P-type)
LASLFLVVIRWYNFIYSIYVCGDSCEETEDYLNQRQFLIWWTNVVIEMLLITRLHVLLFELKWEPVGSKFLILSWVPAKQIRQYLFNCVGSIAFLIGILDRRLFLYNTLSETVFGEELFLCLRIFILFIMLLSVFFIMYLRSIFWWVSLAIFRRAYIILIWRST